MNVEAIQNERKQEVKEEKKWKWRVAENWMFELKKSSVAFETLFAK